MAYDAVSICYKGPDAIMHIICDNISFLPLFELHNDNVFLAGSVCAGDYKVNSLGSQRNIVLNTDAYLIVNLGIVHNISHELHRILP